MMSDTLRIGVDHARGAIDPRFDARQRDVTLAMAEKLHRFMLIDEAILVGALLRMNDRRAGNRESEDR
jgi:hypothetical protein